MPSQRTLAALASLGVCLLAACGSDDESSSSSSSSPTKVAIKVTESGKTSKLELPSEIEAGLTELTFENTGKRPHSAGLIRVEDDHTPEEVGKVIMTEGGPIPEWLAGGAGLGTVPPGKSKTVTQVLEPGTYYAMDDEGGEGAPSDFVKVEVTGEGGGELPSAPASIVASEYTFKADGLKAGKNEVTFDNAGEELHHIIAFPFNKGASTAAVKKFFSSEDEPSGPPPVDFEKGDSTAVIDGGEKQVVDLELVKGKYALICFIQDRAGGPPHVMKGMLAEADVQ